MCVLRVYKWILLNYDVFMFLKIVSILTNSSESCDMQHYSAFHMGLHCLPKSPFWYSTVDAVIP